VTALIAWPSFHLRDGTEVDNQVAAPAETRTPNLHRANQSAHRECGWKGGDSGDSAGKKQRDQQISKRIPLTPTGLLMEGDYTNYPAPTVPEADTLTVLSDFGRAAERARDLLSQQTPYCSNSPRLPPISLRITRPRCRSRTGTWSPTRYRDQSGIPVRDRTRTRFPAWALLPSRKRKVWD
jgi:hypothetical protein